MPLEPATRLGPFEIIGHLGTGGMGEVYRAKDTRLGRDVALKILPPDVANDPARRARFEQEARAVAALNHPNIVGLYDIGSAADVSFIVTELVPGETLGAILSKGTLPVKKLLDLAAQIADGMASAHGAGITHRDLKPANVMVTGDGRVKILDFGLAKQAKVEADKEGTVTLHRSEAGMIVGTVNYMSPEQAAGKPVDNRSDQFSFGLILYEMVTGKRAFERASSVQTMSAILEDDPPKIEREVPLPLRWVIDRCLAKEPGDRYESTRDLYRDLRSLREHLAEASNTSALTVVAPPPRRRRFLPRLLWFAAGAVVALAGALLLGTGKSKTARSDFHFTPFSFAPGGQTNAVWSPDGKSVAYSSRMAPGARYEIYIRRLDSPAPVQLTKDGLGAVPMAWTPAGRILFSSGRKPAGVWSISTVGGEPESVLAVSDAKDVTASPDGSAVAVLRNGSDGVIGIATSSPAGSPLKPYEPAPFADKEIYNTPHLKFSPDGKQILLMINRKGVEEAWLMPFPANPSNPPHQIWKKLRAMNGTPGVEWMPDNRRVILSLSVNAGGSPDLWTADTKSGEPSPLLSGTTAYMQPAISPDGKQMIVTELSSDYNVFSLDLATAKAEPLIATKRYEAMPFWAAKTPALVYLTDRNGPFEIWMRKGGEDRPVVTLHDFPADSTQWFMGPALSPDGDRIIYTRIEPGGLARLWISSVAGGAPLPLTNHIGTSEFPGAWSPDGNWYAYLQISQGQVDLLKVKTTGQGTPVVLKKNIQDNGGLPAWSPNGDWIHVSDNGELLISPDGKTEKKLGDFQAQSVTFSADSKLLYGIHQDRDHAVLFSADIATGTKHDIGEIPREMWPNTNLSPGMRLSLSPDGKSVAYSGGRQTDNMWLVDGLPEPAKFLGLF